MKKLLFHLGLWLVNRYQGDSVPETFRAEGALMEDTLLSGWFNSEKDELFKSFKISSDDVVLDVGCGDSPFLAFCAERGADLIFADIEAANVQATEEKLNGSNARSLTPIVSDANPLPLENSVASKVIAMEVIEHVDDPQAFLSELFRVGQPGAQYLLTVPDPTAEYLQKKGLAPDSYFAKPNHIRIIARDQFVAMVEEAGLVIEQQEYYGFYWSMWWMFFWVTKQELGATPPHPLLASWTKTWQELLSLDGGDRVKRIMDDFMPKSQAIIARKPW
jgi:ubiquinone/menaquinone biosynthesis C-methylase UbiE